MPRRVSIMVSRVFSEVLPFSETIFGMTNVPNIEMVVKVIEFGFNAYRIDPKCVQFKGVGLNESCSK